eukprot:TRINITY_DN11182_c0_g2_i1.p1 TRINITY_DN11182_c0_g2~~TRINITY_DN11182_c0_g2_i1.p1  ORF type:complete len:160 (-),score=12.22 TRINITY_DN11182_c0_g2_i1:374-853(-)
MQPSILQLVMMNAMAYPAGVPGADELSFSWLSGCRSLPVQPLPGWCGLIILALELFLRLASNTWVSRRLAVQFMYVLFTNSSLGAEYSGVTLWSRSSACGSYFSTIFHRPGVRQLSLLLSEELLTCDGIGRLSRVSGHSCGVLRVEFLSGYMVCGAIAS